MLPFPIISNTNIVPVKPGIKRLAVGANEDSVVLQYNSGQTYAFGTNTSGMYGTGDTNSISTWRILRSDVRLFCVSHNYSILITTDNKVYGSGSLQTIFTSALGYNISNSTTYQDITSAFSIFDISTIKQIVGFNDSGPRLYVIDGSDQLWGIGSNQAYALGAGSSTTRYNWTSITNANNVKSVQPSLYVTWIVKNDGTVWRVGTNSVGTLAANDSTMVYTTFTQYTDLSVLDVSITGYNLIMLLTDNTIRVFGISSSGQAGNGSTSAGLLLNPYNPNLSSIMKLMQPGTCIYTSIVIGSTQMLSTGNNTQGKLGIGSGIGTITRFTNSSTGSLATQNLSEVLFVTGTRGASYYVYQDYVYACGNVEGTLGTARNFWEIMPTPYN